MNTCDTCKWWVRIEEFKTGFCTNENIGNGDDKIDGMETNVDYYKIIITTGPKFGCIHHEPKE